MKNRVVRWILLLIVGFGIGSAIGYFQAQNELDGGVIELSPDENTGNATVLKQPASASEQVANANSMIGGDFTLVDHNGNEVTQADYAENYKLIFFGFTYCPAVCPTELRKVAEILEILGEDGEMVTPIFISVDPERDTVEQMAQYVEQFHPRLVGLTGSMEQIDAVKDAYKVYASKVENEMMEGYMVDHSSFLYFMSPENTLIELYPSKDTAQDIADAVKETIAIAE